MAKGNNSKFDLGSMFEGVKPVDVPAEEPNVKNNIDNNSNKSNILNKDNNNNKAAAKRPTRGRPAIESKSSRIKRTFEVLPDLWSDIQYLARLKNMPLCDLMELMMRKELEENAELMDKIKLLRGD